MMVHIQPQRHAHEPRQDPAREGEVLLRAHAVPPVCDVPEVAAQGPREDVE